jgi:hypothetical protein
MVAHPLRLWWGRLIALLAGFALVIDSFLPWQRIDSTLRWSAWHGVWGITLSLLAILLVVHVAVEAFEVPLPLRVPDGIATVAVASAIAACAVVKTNDDSYSAWGSYLGIALAGVALAGALLIAVAGRPRSG